MITPEKLHEAGHLQLEQNENDCFLHISTPCIFRIEPDIVQLLKMNYNPIEEIGGILSAKPSIIDNRRVFVIDEVKFIRNAIEDNHRKDGLNKTNAYLPDQNLLNEELLKTIEQDYLPIKFHTHPIKGHEHFETIISSNLQTNTSEQDMRESDLRLEIGKNKLLMPRCLIVGNGINTTDIFIGMYNGFVAPTSFEASKKKVADENIKKTADLISSVNLTNGQKLGLGIGAALLLYSIIKYPKYNFPVIFGLIATIPLFLTNTQNIKRPEYFNRLSFGKADIYIP